MNPGLIVPEKVDSIRRLRRNPPVEWSGRTVWVAIEEDDESILREYAHINCPECCEKAYWAAGNMACEHCRTRRRLVG